MSYDMNHYFRFVSLYYYNKVKLITCQQKNAPQRGQVWGIQNLFYNEISSSPAARNLTMLLI